MGGEIITLEKERENKRERERERWGIFHKRNIERLKWMEK